MLGKRECWMPEPPLERGDAGWALDWLLEVTGMRMERLGKPKPRGGGTRWFSAAS